MSLRRLGVEQIGLWQLHRIDAQVPLEDSLGAVKELQDAGKIKHIGLSEVSVASSSRPAGSSTSSRCRTSTTSATGSPRRSCSTASARGIAFLPWFPVAAGELARPGGLLDEIAADHDATHAQLALAWLLRRSPVMLPIPGTGSVEHLEENCAAALVELSDDEYAALTAAGEA
jgi:aryl-alcohol dehydrogenase-like predicted oxidoreductase